MTFGNQEWKQIQHWNNINHFRGLWYHNSVIGCRNICWSTNREVHKKKKKRHVPFTHTLLYALAKWEWNGADGGPCLPFRAPWKKNLTINTCRQDIVTIIRDSITEKLNIRDSVERTVLKLRFSRVRKYFWLREIVESWPESLKRDSSREERCSGEVPCFEGSSARASFSTCNLSLATELFDDRGWISYSDLKVYHLLSKSRHIIRETKTVIADFIHRKNKVSLPFLRSLKDDFIVGAGHLVVDIKRAARLDLSRNLKVKREPS